MELVSLSTFLSTYVKRTNIQPEELDEDIVLDFAIDAVQKLHSIKTCNHVVALLPVVNYNAQKPTDFYNIVEIAYKNEDFRKTRLQYHDEVISWTDKNFAGCDVKISVECPECHEHRCACGDDSVIIKVDDEWLMANVERYYWNNPRYIGVHGLNKMGGIGSAHHPEFSLMKPARHRFFAANSHVKGCLNLDHRLLGDWPIEYKLENRKIRTNVESGTILLAYNATPKDEAGFPLAPDDVDAFNAIFWDVEAKMCYRNKGKDKDNYRYSQDAERKAAVYMEEALKKINAISPQEWKVIVQANFRMIPYWDNDVQGNRAMADKFRGAMNRYRYG